jgi:hypothetical protein
MSTLRPLAKAITDRLRGDATLMALLPGGVHNGSAPSSAARPYLVFGAPTEQPENTLDRYGYQVTYEFDAFSAPSVRTSAVVDEILDRVEVLLRTPLTLDGHSAARGWIEFRTVQVEEDETRHGTGRFSFLADETP